MSTKNKDCTLPLSSSVNHLNCNHERIAGGSFVVEENHLCSPKGKTPSLNYSPQGS